MSKAIKALAVAGTLAFAAVIDAVVLSANENPYDVEGFGATTTGGFEGEVITVTTLEDSGPGSLRWAIEENYAPRTIEFDVAGEIALSHQIEIRENVTIAGESAPGHITITGGRLRVIGDNVVISGLRIRPGDGPGQPFESRDGISIGKKGVSVENVVIDGNSITYAIDESLAVFGDVQNVTISNNIIANSLDESLHPSGGHSMGILIANGATKVSVFGNLIANNANRNPTINGEETQKIEFINNLVYNWSENGLHTNGAEVHAIGNVYKPGPDTVVPDAFILKTGKANGDLVYLEDNIATLKRADGVSDRPLFRDSGVAILPSSEVSEHVLNRAGAGPEARDIIDSAIIAGVRNATGRIIDTPSDLYEQTASVLLDGLGN